MNSNSTSYSLIHKTNPTKKGRQQNFFFFSPGSRGTSQEVVSSSLVISLLQEKVYKGLYRGRVRNLETRLISLQWCDCTKSFPLQITQVISTSELELPNISNFCLKALLNPNVYKNVISCLHPHLFVQINSSIKL